MTWSFDPQLGSARDRVRHAVGDIDADAPLRDDETIDALLGALGEQGATAALAEGLAAQYAREPSSFGTTGLTVGWADRVKTWLTLASRIREAAGAATAGVMGVAQLARGDGASAEYVREW